MVLLANACHAFPVALLLIVAARSLDVCDALDNGAGRTPPMGWGSWIQHHIAPTAAILKKAADDMVDVGLKAAGWDLIQLDDGWAYSPGR